MNCAACAKILDKWEEAQPMTVLGKRVYPQSFCSDCISPWLPGSRRALDTLVYGPVKAEAIHGPPEAA